MVKSTNAERMKRNLDAALVTLDADDMNALENLTDYGGAEMGAYKKKVAAVSVKGVTVFGSVDLPPMKFYEDEIGVTRGGA